MATFDDFRNRFPSLKDASDEEIIERASKVFNLPIETVMDGFGYQLNEPGMVANVKRGIGNIVESTGSTLRDIGAPDVGKSIERYGRDITFKNPSEINTVSEALQRPGTTVNEAVGEVAPQIGASLTTGAIGGVVGRYAGGALGSLAGPGGTVAGAVGGGYLGFKAGQFLGNLSQEYGGIRTEQREAGINEKGRALAAAGAAAALDTGFGVEGVLGKVAKGGLNILSREAGKSLTGHVLKQGAIGLGTEALTEGGQTALERWGAKKDLLNDEAVNEYGMSMIKGGIGGGAIRGGMSAFAGTHKPELPNGKPDDGSGISQAISQQSASNPPITTNNLKIDPLSRLAELDAISNGTRAREHITPDGEVIKIPGTEGRYFTEAERNEYAALKSTVNQNQPAPAQTAPAVVGGATDVAVAQKAAQQQQQAQQQQEEQQQATAKAAEAFQVVNPDTPAVGNALGQKVYGPANIQSVATALANFTSQMSPVQVQLLQAVNKANTETGGQLIKFKFNANDVIASVQKGLQAAEKVATQLQITHVQSVDEAAAILNDQSEQVKGDKLEQLNAIFQALTGQNTNGYEAEQLSQLAKGAKNGKLQLQTNAGVREVPISGGPTEAGAGGNGPVRPTEVQPIGTTGLGKGSLGLQVGQSPTSGVRTGTPALPALSNGSVATPNTQVTGATNVQPQSIVGGGQVSGQPEQTAATNVGEQNVQNGPRVYATPPSYYATDLSHIQGERRIQVILDLFTTALKPLQERSNTASAETRAEVLRLALMEQFPHKDIAEFTGLSESAVQKQLERMGVKEVKGMFEVVDLNVAKLIVKAAEDYRSPEFPDGIGEGELAALYTTRYVGEERQTQSLSEELQQEGTKPQAKLAEELHDRDTGTTKSMGTVATAGGSQSAVDSVKEADEKFFAKIGKLNAMLDTLEEGDVAGRKNIEKQLQAEWAKYGKTQASRAEEGMVEVAEPAAETDLTGAPLFEEEDNAVQVKGADEGNVRKPAGGGKEVGKANAEPKKPARARKAKTEVNADKTAQEVVVLTPQEQWEALATDYKEMPTYGSLTKDQKIRWDDLASRGQADITDVVLITKQAGQTTSKAGATEALGAPRATQALTDESNIIDGTGLVRVLTPEQTQVLAGPVAKLTDGQTSRLERHYGFKRGTEEFLSRLHEDLTKYATKGAEAVSAAIRDVIKTVYVSMLATAVAFNPTYMSSAEAFVYHAPQEYSTTTEVRATPPAEAAAKMSPAAKEAYATLQPALKVDLTARDKLLIIADKPSGRIFVFTPDGKLVLEKKSLFGFAKGDFYKGNNDLPSNRITPAGLHNIVMVDAAKGGAAAKTAGEYDFGKVFGIVDKNPGVLTIMHSVWLHEKDAAQRAAALKNESAADSRYSFGCINVDKATYKTLLDNHGNQMDGAKLFVVPDNQARLQEFVTGKVAQNLTGEDTLVRQAVTPVTQTVSGVRQNAQQATDFDRTQVGKEEEAAIQKSPIFRAMRTLRDVNATDLDGFNADYNERDLSDMERVPGFKTAIDSYRNNGLGHVLDAVDGWYTTFDNVNWDGAFTVLDGKPAIAFRAQSMMDQDSTEWTTHHEIGHAIDQIHREDGGVFSNEPEFNVSVTAKGINARGSIIKAVFDDYNANPDGDLARRLQYPFDQKAHPGMSAQEMREEVFAQLWAAFNTRDGRSYLEEHLPAVADYMGDVYEAVKATKFSTGTQVESQTQGSTNQAPANRVPQPRQVPTGQQVFRANRREEVSGGKGAFAKAGEWLDTALTDPKAAIHNLKLGFLTLNQLSTLDKSPDQVVRSYADISNHMMMASKEMVDRAVKIDHLWAKLTPAMSAKLSNVMRTATRLQFDPDLSGKTSNKTSAQEDELLAGYAALDDSARNIYRKVRQHYEDLFEKRKAILEKSAAKLGGKELKEVQEMYAKLKGPYFPLGRTGDFYAVGMSPRVAELVAKKEDEGLNSAETIELRRLRKEKDQYITSTFKSLSEAKKAAAEFEKSHGTAYFNQVDKTLQERMGNQTNFAKLEDYITTQLGGETRAQVKSMLSQMMFDMLPEHHALKQQMRREGIHGENENMRQVFAQTSLSQAHYISRLQYGEQLNEAMQRVAKAARRDYEMRTIEIELKKRTQLSLDNTQSRVVDALMNASYFAHLGISPAFLITNMTQVPMITAPWLYARHGLGNTKRAMAEAMADAAGIIKTSYQDGDWRSELKWNDKFPVGSREDRMFRDLLARNELDITMEHDLAAVAAANQGFLDDKIASATKNKLTGMGDVVRLVNTPVRITELANRATTALSAYRLKWEALASAGLNEEDRHRVATDYAARAVSETQLNYSELNAPRLMRQVFGSKPLAKLVFQFRKYQQGMLYLVTKSIADAMPNSKANAEDRRIARRTLGGLYATTGLMAGTTGMPLMGTVGLAGILNTVAALFGDKDEPWDFETEYRNFLTDWLGHDMALIVAKGLPAYLGADLSAKVGMAEIANPIPYVQRGSTGQSTVANVMSAFGGAAVGMAGSMVDGVMDMANGDVLKGMEKVIPLREAKDLLRTYRYSDEGLTDKRGNVILPPESFSAWDLALRGMGFTPTIESEYYAANSALKNAEQAAKDVRNSLLRQYSEARVKDADIDAIQDKIDAFNDRHPEQGLRITVSNLLRAIQERRKMAEQRTASGVYIGKKQKPFADEARFADTEQE